MPSYGYLKNTPATLLKVPDPERQLILSLTQLRGHGSCNSNTYLFLNLSLTHLNLEIAKSNPAHWVSEYLAGRRHEVPTDPDHCGVINETFTHLAVSACVSKDVIRARKFVGLVHDAAILKPESGGSCEWLYGRAGTLYLLRRMRAFAPACTDIVELTIGGLVKVIMEIRRRDGHWEWHGKEYLGAVHGSIGIVTQIALSCDAMALKREQGVQEQILGPLEAILSSLLTKQRADGNWPPRVNSRKGNDDLVQFCHGAPGFVIYFQALIDHRLFLGIQGMDETISKARKVI